MPPVANHERLGDDIAPIDVVHGAPRTIERAPVLSNSFGFGGHNATLVLVPATTDAARRQAHPRHRGAQRPVHRASASRARPGAGCRGGAVVVRPDHAPHRADGAEAAGGARRSSSSTSPTRRTSTRSPTGCRSTSTACVHAIGFAPESCLGGGFLDAPWEDVAVAMQVSAYSLKALARGRAPPARRRRRRSSGSTSTTSTTRGRSTTGWAWRRPRSSRPRGTSPASSGRGGSA